MSGGERWACRGHDSNDGEVVSSFHIKFIQQSLLFLKVETHIINMCDEMK